MKLTDFIVQEINELNAKNGHITNWTALHTEKEIIDEHGKSHRLNGQYKERT